MIYDICINMELIKMRYRNWQMQESWLLQMNLIFWVEHNVNWKQKEDSNKKMKHVEALDSWDQH